MVKLFIFILSIEALSCNGQNIDNLIRFDHVGESDKPINSILISTHEIRAADHEVFFKVRKELFVEVNDYVIKNRTNDAEVKQSNYGVFKITIITKDSHIEYFLLTRKASMNFFKELKTRLDNKGSSKLSQELEVLLKRISY
jgi:hypothetical protein